MRITRDTLLKAAKTYVIQRTNRDRHIICVYLTGSLIDDLPLLGGTADIDLVFVHDDQTPPPREIVRLTPTVHLDLAHHDQSIYKEPRSLRLDPWVGSSLIKDPVVLHGTQHWFEYIQASVFSQFSQPENVYNRALPMVERARQTWLNDQLDPQEPNIDHIWAYLKALEEASNALIVLDSPPLTERRFMLNFHERTREIGHPELEPALVNLFIPSETVMNELTQWVELWKNDLKTLENETEYPVELHPHRLNYYTNAVDALVVDHPAAALWILLRTWTRFALYYKEDSKRMQNWENFFTQGHYLGEGYQERLDGLDQYLDKIEEIIETWAKQNGIEINA